MEIKIIEVLNEIAKNESENFGAFREKLAEYCTKEKESFRLLRLLNDIKSELKDCLTGLIEANVDRVIVKKVHKIVKTELFIIKIKLKRPELFKSSELNNPVSDVEWTDDKLDAIELITALCLTKSINHGKITKTDFQKFFEWVFQVELGNISNRINAIEIRKENDSLFLEKLLTNLKEFLDGRNK